MSANLREAVEAAATDLFHVAVVAGEGVADRETYRRDALTVLLAAAPLIEAQVRAQVAAEAVASDRSHHDDAHSLLRDFADGCGDGACGICCGDS